MMIKLFSKPFMLACLLLLPEWIMADPLPALQTPSTDPGLVQFKLAWQAAGKGDRATFEKIKPGLGDYVLYPYLQYEDFRFRRNTIAPQEMAAFFESHADWAFTAGLRKTWLRSLGQGKKWDELLLYASAELDTEVQCYLAQARIERNLTDQLLPQVQTLWAVGKSQPKACDPVFHWLRKVDGITPALAWTRINRAIEARQVGLTQYLTRFVPANDRVWVERWQKQEQQAYRRLDQVGNWRDSTKARDIIGFGIKVLARKDPDRAWKFFATLEPKFQWGADQSASILREIALWSAVDHVPDAIVRLHAVPAMARDDVLLEWWARNGLATDNWAEVVLAVADMSDEMKNTDRWRYWDARARLQLGEPDYAKDRMNELSWQASYYGFLAADYLDQPYSICPQIPSVNAQAFAEFKKSPVIRRIMALHAAGLTAWARGEWTLSIKKMDKADLQMAAALASEQDWPNLAILALASSGDRNWYEWRFPLVFSSLVEEQAGKRNLDVAWVMGLIRAESAMAEDAVSPANARGLMQVLPATAAQLASRHPHKYRGSEQLMQAENNIIFGTIFLRELMDRFQENPVLVSGAYNAGPAAVDRWLKNLPRQDPAIWVEVLPYYETRDYIPRVLAFATIYNWRLQQPVQRITSRMPALDSGSIVVGPTTATAVEVACMDLTAAAISGS